MKNHVWKAILAALSLLLGAGAGVAAPAGWKLVWADEFDHKGLPDTNKWDYETGFVRNHESQYYTRSRKENARVEKGMLVIEGRKEKFENAEYTSASLISLNKKNPLYGRIEVRAKLPRGLGVWPAIWTLGANHKEAGWPRCGEIDIMEYVGKDPNHIYGTVHFPLGGREKSNGGNYQSKEPVEGFHTYAIEWSPEHIDFYFDSIKYHTFNVEDAGAGEDNPFRKPHYLILNLALGGTWGGKIDDSLFPQKFYIDYVRMYERKEKK